MESIQNKGS
jgi:hypothetical protein